MKMKVKKIKGIEKDVCCSEQMIAYNFAHKWSRDFRKALNEARTEIDVSEQLFKIENSVVKELLHGPEDFSSFNIDAVIVAFRQGFRKYCENGAKLFRDYSDVGNAFPIPYGIY